MTMRDQTVPAAGIRAVPNRNPILFVVGAARSGTTLLQRMLDAHPQLAVVNETYWVPRKFRERLGLTRAGLVTQELFPMLLESSKFDRMGLSMDDLRELLGNEPVTYPEFVGRMFDRYANRQGKVYAGDKTPGYVRRMALLAEQFSDARFIHIVRDPRDVAASMLDWSSGERTAGQFGTWQLDPVASSGLYWRYSVSMGAKAGAELGSHRYREVRYEDLVADSRRELQRLCEFVGLPYEPVMLDFHVGRSRPKPGRSSKAQWLPPTAGLRDWRCQLAAYEIAAIEYVVGPWLGHYGYPPSEHVEPPDVAALDKVREVFTSFLTDQQRPVPDSW